MAVDMKRHCSSFCSGEIRILQNKTGLSQRLAINKYRGMNTMPRACIIWNIEQSLYIT